MFSRKGASITVTEAPVRQVFQRQFAGVPQSLAQVRRFVAASALAAGVPQSLLDDLVLVGDELAGNAIAHTESGRSGGTFSVRVDIAADHQVTLHVRDCGGGGGGYGLARAGGRARIRGR
jgi:serine/threonine-protein kinase RsbW